MTNRMPLPAGVRGLSRRVRRLAELDAADMGLFIRVVSVGATVPLFLRLPLTRQAALLAPGTDGRREERAGRGRRRLDADRPEDVARLTRCVELAQDVARPLVRSGCLTRGIVLYWFLGRGDEDIQLYFGLGRPGDRVDYSGHCWLTRQGQPYLESVDPRTSFSVIYQIPSIPAASG